MIEDLSVFSADGSVGASIEYSTGDFYVKSAGHVYASPNVATAIATSIGYGPKRLSTSSFTNASTSSASAQSGIGHGVSFARSFASLI
jgi:hypothetical protein